MLHHFAGATIQVANVVKYNCYPLEDGNIPVKYLAGIHSTTFNALYIHPMLDSIL